LPTVDLRHPIAALCKPTTDRLDHIFIQNEIEVHGIGKAFSRRIV
jgi:hypothetical protein